MIRPSGLLTDIEPTYSSGGVACTADMTGQNIVKRSATSTIETLFVLTIFASSKKIEYFSSPGANSAA
jgi:hypothetical protein